MILCNSDEQESKQSRYLDLLEEHRVIRILITPVAGAGTVLTRLRQRDTPAVLVDSGFPSRGQCSVAVDDVLGGERAISARPSDSRAADPLTHQKTRSAAVVAFSAPIGCHQFYYNMVTTMG